MNWAAISSNSNDIVIWVVWVNACVSKMPLAARISNEYKRNTDDYIFHASNVLIIILLNYICKLSFLIILKILRYCFRYFYRNK